MKKILILSLVLFFAGCSTVGMTGRRQFMLYSESDEIAMGEQSFRQILSSAKVINNASGQRVERVGRRLAAVSGKNYDWEFVLINDSQVNAFCLPGGKVGVYMGILKIATTDDMLAVVMGHEIAHALARHGMESMSQNSLLNIGGAILGARQETAVFAQAYGVATSVGVALPYSRKHETEAYDMGLILMAKAGYNPSVAVDFWTKMASLSSGGKSDFLSTHPSDAKRINNIKAKLPEAMQYYYSAVR